MAKSSNERFWLRGKNESFESRSIKARFFFTVNIDEIENVRHMGLLHRRWERCHFVYFFAKKSKWK